MWHMLVSRGTETQITFSDVRASDQEGTSQWIAIYPYGDKKRRVKNIVSSSFKFKDGKIIEQKDSFDLHAWLGMALGPLGKILGWTKFMQSNMQKVAAKRLNDFLDAHPEYKN